MFSFISAPQRRQGEALQMRCMWQMLYYVGHFEETPEGGVWKRKAVEVSLLLVEVLLQEGRTSAFSRAAQVFVTLSFEFRILVGNILYL